MAGEDIYSRSPRKEVQYHLRGDFLRIGAHPLLYYTVIPGHNNNDLILDFGHGFLFYPCQFYSQFFKYPQTPFRFGQAVQAFFCPLH